MKKYIFMILFLFLLIPNTVLAKDGTKRMYMNIDIKEDGSLDVEEVAELSGEYNGRLRNIEYQNKDAKTFTGSYEDFKGSSIYNGSAITDLKVCETSLNFTEKNFRCEKEYARTTYGTNGMSGAYEEIDTISGVNLKIYNPSERKKAFYLSYTIKDAVVLHNDVAELAWNLLENSYEEDIEEFKVWVNLPENDSNFRVWLKGSEKTLNGEVRRENNKTAYIYYNFLGAYNPVTVRMMFDKSLVSIASKFSHVDGKENILKVEKEAAEEANRIRDRIKRQNGMIMIVTIIWFFLSILSFVYFVISKRKNQKTDFYQDYYRELPATYGPEILEYLLKKNVTDQAFSASILNIIDQKVLKLEENPKKKDDYFLILENKEMASLTENEKLLCTLLIEKIGNGERVSLSAIKNYGNDVRKAKTLISQYNLWIEQVKKEGKKEQFFTGVDKSQIIMLLVGMASAVIVFLNATFETGFIPGYLAILLGVLEVFYAMIYSFKTKKGSLEYAKWQAFKNFIKDFGLLDEKELPEIKLWGKYLVYASVLGCAKEVEKAMKIRLDAMNIDESNTLYYDYYYTNRLVRANLYTTISSSMATAVSSSRSSIAASNSSSSSGLGGGSSFGGGSFGGGGGGGRF